LTLANGTARSETMRWTGQMSSQAIALLVSALHLGASQIEPQIYSQFLMAIKMVFMTLAALCVRGILLAGQRKNEAAGEWTQRLKS